jgi:hypothetical protein
MRDLLDTVSGDGGDARMPAEDLDALLTEMSRIADKCGDYAQQRMDNANTRHNIWSGRSPDGRLHRERLRREPRPFEGASDQRVWLVDELCNEHVILGMAALFRADVRCAPVGGAADSTRAGKLTVLLQWLINRMGLDWWAQHMILLNYLHQDSPAVAMMRLGWETKTTVEMKSLSVEELTGLWMQEFAQRAAAAGVQPDEQQMKDAAQSFSTLLMGSDGADGSDGSAKEELAQMIVRYFPRVKPARARRVVTQLRKEGKAEFPVKSEAFGGPTCVAREFGVDFFVPDNTRKFNRCRAWFEPEWLSASELHARVAQDGWDPEFVKEVLKHEAKSAFPEYWPDTDGILGKLAANAPDIHKGEYQIVWCNFQAVNADGVPGRYYAAVHRQARMDAFGRRILRAHATTWDAVLHRREYIDQYALNSRGVPEIAGPDQSIMKLMRDLTTDNAHVGAVPTVFASGFRSKERILLRQLGTVHSDRVGSTLSFLQPPAFPASGFRVLDEIKAGAGTRWGRPGKDADPTAVQLYREVFVGMFLGGIRDELQILLDLALANMSDDDLAAVMDDRGRPIARSMKEIEGQYEAQVSFDPNDLDWKRLTEMAGSVLPGLIQMDSDKVIDASAFVRYLVRAMAPKMAREGLRPANEGTEQEIRSEQHNLLLLRAGLIPEMDTEGRWNFPVRVKMYEDMEAQSQPAPAPWDPQQQIPEVWADMGPDKYGNMLRWRAALAKQAEQFGANAQIGRSMVKDAQGVQAVGGDAGGEG